ncbi:ankyrin repeat domain-containing protein [Erysipelothrix sp. D19-032]
MNSKQETLILIATHNNDVPIAQLLIDNGANVNLQDTILDSAYLYAGAQGRTEILDYMLRHADIDFSVVNRYGGNTLIPAVRKVILTPCAYSSQIRTLISIFKTTLVTTALIEVVALTDGSEVFQEIVQVLVDHGLDTNLRDNSGKSDVGLCTRTSVCNHDSNTSINKKRYPMARISFFLYTLTGIPVSL